MATLPLEQFLRLIPDCPGSDALPVHTLRDAAQYVTAPLGAFVPPNLSNRADVDNPANPKVVVVSAAGAVGKTTLAREIARTKAAPFWDLASSGPVGQHTLHGMLATTFGPQRLGALYDDLTRGRLFLVIDALDEARVKVNEAAFEAFLSDIASTAASSAGPSFLLLGRTQIAETTWLLLENLGVTTALFVIEPFTRIQANEYIERRVRSFGGPGLRHPVPFVEARDLIFKNLERALGHEHTISADFLGYAPVLDSIAVLLGGETNLSRLIERLRTAQTDDSNVLKSDPATILSLVVERILEREHTEKLVTNIKPSLEPLAVANGWSSWQELYTSEEQCRRLLARILRVSDDRTPVKLPPALRGAYETHLSSWLPEHPFLRDGHVPANTVFESFLFAKALHNDYGMSSSAVQQRLDEPSYKPSRLFADFYFFMQKEAASALVPPRHISWLYESLLSAESDRAFLRFSLEGQESSDPTESEGSDVDGEFAMNTLTEQGEVSIQPVAFTTRLRASDTIVLGRYVRDASITVPSSLVLGTGSTDFEIGPSVFISCQELRISATTLVVGGRTLPRPARDNEYDPTVVLEAAEYVGTLSTRPVTHVPLRVRWPGANVFPWTEFQSLGSRDLDDDWRLGEAYLRFRRIVMTLQSNGKGSLARTRHKVEHARVLRGQMGQVLLEALVTDGVLRLQEGFYFWVPEIASRVVSVSWLQLRKGDVSPTLASYLRQFVAQNSSLFKR